MLLSIFLVYYIYNHTIFFLFLQHFFTYLLLKKWPNFDISKSNHNIKNHEIAFSFHISYVMHTGRLERGSYTISASMEKAFFNTSAFITCSGVP